MKYRVVVYELVEVPVSADGGATFLFPREGPIAFQTDLEQRPNFEKLLVALRPPRIRKPRALLKKA